MYIKNIFTTIRVRKNLVDMHLNIINGYKHYTVRTYMMIFVQRSNHKQFTLAKD
jgi:hypothetical protein